MPDRILEPRTLSEVKASSKMNEWTPLSPIIIVTAHTLEKMMGKMSYACQHLAKPFGVLNPLKSPMEEGSSLQH